VNAWPVQAAGASSSVESGACPRRFPRTTAAALRAAGRQGRESVEPARRAGVTAGLARGRGGEGTNMIRPGPCPVRCDRKS
jgi:hypothetical protein